MTETLRRSNYISGKHPHLSNIEYEEADKPAQEAHINNKLRIGNKYRDLIHQAVKEAEESANNPELPLPTFGQKSIAMV